MALPIAALLLSTAAAQQREFRFEVLSFRLIKPGTSLQFNDHPTPNGFRATLSLWQAVMLA
jgi:hypothetical protein